MRVFIPSPLVSYTNGQTMVEATGASLHEVLRDLNERYPGIRFRMIDEQDRVREHMRIFVNGEQLLDLNAGIYANSEIRIIAALSGG